MGTTISLTGDIFSATNNLIVVVLYDFRGKILIRSHIRRGNIAGLEQLVTKVQDSFVLIVEVVQIELCKDRIVNLILLLQ